MYSGEAFEASRSRTCLTRCSPLYAKRCFGSRFRCGRPINSRHTGRHPRATLPPAHERPNGCNSAPRCDLLLEGRRCDVARDQGWRKVAGNDRHGTRCLRFEQIDWAAPLQLARTKGKGRDRRCRSAHGKTPQENYYEVAGKRGCFEGPTKKRFRKRPNETLTFEARESETLAICGRIRLR